jgi:hypothetical protein
MQNWYGILGLHLYSVECSYLKAPQDQEIQPATLYLYLEADKLTYKTKDNDGKIITAKIEPHELGAHYSSIKTLLQSPNKKKLTPEQTEAIQTLAAKRGLTRAAHEVSEQHIKAAYRKLALETHPDKGGDAEKFKRISEAYSTLIDPEERRRFDEEWASSPDTLDETFAQKGVSAFYTLTTNAKPHSQAFKTQHAQWVKQYQLQPLMRGSVLSFLKPFEPNGYFLEKSDGSQTEYSDLFLFLKEKAKHTPPPSQQDPLLLQPLTLANAVDMLINFVEGDYYGAALTALASYLQENIRKAKTANIYCRELPLYEGFQSLVTISLSQVTPIALIDALQKIIDYAKETPAQTMLFMAALLQNKYFRQLVANSLHHYWQTPLISLEPKTLKALDAQETAKTILMNLSKRSKQAFATERAELDELIRYIRLLYIFEKDTFSTIDTGTTGTFYRDKAYHIIDWLPAFSGKASSDVFINIFLLAGLCFQLASAKETVPALQMADEQSALNLYLSAVRMTEHASPNIVLYAHTHVIKVIAQFKFQEPSLKAILPLLQKSALKIADMFPFYVPLQSNLAHLTQTHESLALMRELLQALNKIIEKNKAQPATAAPLDHRYVNVLYAIYEACLKGWYENSHLPQTEQAAKLALMQQLLSDKRWRFLDVNKHLQSPWIAIERDAQKWMLPRAQLPIPSHPGLDVFRAVEGVTIDYKTGDICFVFKPWQAQDPLWAKALTLFDLQELIQKNIVGGFFSLDPVKPDMPYHPFNQMRFGPPQLYETQLLHSMLLTDYLLKFLTVGQEVQGGHPYAGRSLDTLLAPLPEYLKKIIHDFHQEQSEASLHRFWIEARDLPLTSTSQEAAGVEQEHVALGDLKMVVKKHVMRRNLKGELVDSIEDDEGWSFYILTPAQKQAVEQGRQKITAPSLVILEGQTTVYCYQG